jgi:acylphosphatase
VPSTHAKVTGHVQGVGFRAHVKWVANRLNVKGEVWNTRDGAVEVIAQHWDQEQLDKFIQQLHEGPGSVANVELHSIPDDASRVTFSVVPTR